jgi:hypothetical protein
MDPMMFFLAIDIFDKFIQIYGIDRKNAIPALPGKSGQFGRLVLEPSG